MSTSSVRNAIAALAAMTDGDLTAAATNLMSALGYRSERTLPDQSGDAGDFIRQLPNANLGTQSAQALLDNAQSMNVLFQFTSGEIQAETQRTMFDAAGFDTGNARSFLFAAVQLRDDTYARGRYAAFTRELNKYLPMPMVVLFRTSTSRITLAFVHRQPNKRDPERDVLGNVSLIREINAAEPHRAHLDILAELSLPERLKWMDAHGKPHNFDGLLDAWLDALDTEELNKRFYKELFAWFERAAKTATFPTEEARTLPAEEHVIRLITRLMFVWFIKEKGLVSEDLFIENRASELLKDYNREAGDSYYRAVLQNLFFATLNTEIAQRGFSAGNNSTHREFSYYRYRKEMTDPDALLALFDATPFINGGLFDCLDSFEGQRSGGYRIDCFSDVHYGKLSIPNWLFFGEGAAEPGLIDLFNRYKFTVEENTPTEQEVALDPELLGKVFENLLAAVNPETQQTARKETGSYYTPRAVVDYMVDEALVATLAQKASPEDGDAGHWQARLRYLLDYGDAFADVETLFTPTEREAIVRVIAGLKALDPAVGSGAFPMGALHKLTLALRRLDERNELWERVQREEAANRSADAYRSLGNDEQRHEALVEVENTFRRYRDSDFGRKLYLIQNSIYGVDIQPIATQIAKLRFFISLAIEQQPNDDPADNYGIRPLPNLETRFVAADTLLALDSSQGALTSQHARQLQSELRQNRERYFHANTRALKRRWRDEDQRLRGELADELRQIGMAPSDADKIAACDLFDQNAPAADWFDAEYMFGVNDGFDVVIGNPPYIQLQKDAGRLGTFYKDAGYSTFVRTGDIYQLFCERGCRLLATSSGILSYITSNSWLKAEYGKNTRRYFAERHTPLYVLEMGKDVFESAIVDSCVLIARAGRHDAIAKAIDLDKAPARDFPPYAEHWGELRLDGETPWSILTPVERSIMDKMLAVGTPLKEWDIAINYGIKTGFNDAFIVDNQTKEALVAADPKSAEIIKPVVRGRDIRRYRAKWANLWLIDTHNGYSDTPAINIDDFSAVKAHLDGYFPRLAKRYDKGTTPYNLRNCAYHADFAKEKLLWIELVNRGRFAYDDSGLYGEATTFLLTGESIKYLCAVLNSKLIRWCLENMAPTSGMGTLRWKKVYVERLPIPRIAGLDQRPFDQMIDTILAAIAHDPNSDTADAEAKIDEMVYQLYGLTASEISAVEERI